MKHTTLSVFDHMGKKVCDQYDSKVNSPGQAHTICLTTEINGWKELSFVMPYIVDKKSNFRWKYIRNEYRLRLRRGDSEDWFTITRPKRSKGSGQISNTVVCYHISSVLKTKNLYLQFDDTNGIDTCANLITKALSGTGWALGVCDTFYESDGKTEKIRSLASSGKVGSYQLITNICGLFNAYPVYNGATKTVDIHALSSKLPQEEMIVGHNLSALSVEFDSDSIVTRLYVEGEYGEDGYVGIDDVNPTGLSYLQNFDYYKAVGQFGNDHQAALDTYHKDISAVNKNIKLLVENIIQLENDLNTIWGQPKFVYYVSGLPYYFSEGLTDEEKKLSVGDEVYTLLSDGTYSVGDYSGGTHEDMVKFVTKTSYAMGSKEVAIEAKQKMIESLEGDLKKADEEDVAAINEKIQTLRNEISDIYNGTAESEGLYPQMHRASVAVKSLKVARDNLSASQTEQAQIEATFTAAMGDLLKDGYWANTNYVEGQEAFLYADAVEMSAELTKPTVSYSITQVQASDIWGEVETEFLINSKVRIFDPELQVNDIVFVTKTVEYLDDQSKGSAEISNDNLSIVGKSFDSILGRITQQADMIDQKTSLIDRAEAIGKDGTISVTNLEGQIDLLKNKLLSSTSNWYTDDNGNIIFLSVNGRSAMMLSGEGFMIANGKTADGEWNWRTFGTGQGFVADEITSGFLNADRIRAGSISNYKLDSTTQNLLKWVEGSEIRLSDDGIKSTVTDTVIDEMNQEGSVMRQSVINQTASSIRLEFNEALAGIENTKVMQNNINAWFDFSGTGLKIGGKTSDGEDSPFYTLQNHTEYAFYKKNPNEDTKLVTITGEGIDMLEGRQTQGNESNKLTADGILSLSDGSILLNGKTNEVTIGQNGGTVNIGTDGTGIINLSAYQVRSGTESVAYNTKYNVGSNAATSSASSEFVYTTTDNAGVQSSNKFTITTTYTRADLQSNTAPAIASGKLIQIVYEGRGIDIYADTSKDQMILAPSVPTGHLMGWDLISSNTVTAAQMSTDSIVANSMFMPSANGGLVAVADQKWTIDKIMEVLNNNNIIPSLKAAEGRVATIADTISVHATTIEAHTQNLLTHATNIETNATNIKTNADKINVVADDLNVQAEQVNVLADQIKLLATEKSIAELEGRVTESEASITVLSNRIDSMATQSSIEKLVTQVNTVSQSLDAANAAISTKAEQSYVDNTIGNVVTRVQTAEQLIDAANAEILNRATKAEVTETNERIGEAETRISAAEGLISQKASITDVEGVTSRISTAEQRIDAANAEISNKVSIEDFDGMETRVQQAEVKINAAEETITLQAGTLNEHGERIGGAEVKINGLEESIELNAKNIGLNADEIQANADNISIVSDALEVLTDSFNLRAEQIDLLGGTVNDLGQWKETASLQINGLTGEISGKASVIQLQTLGNDVDTRLGSVNSQLGSVMVRLDDAENELQLQAENINAKGEQINAVVGTVDELGNWKETASVAIDGLTGTISTHADLIKNKADIYEIEAIKTTIKGLVTIEELEADYAKASELEALESTISDLTGGRANFTALSASVATISDLNTTYLSATSFSFAGSTISKRSITMGALSSAGQALTTGEIDLSHSHLVTVNSDGTIKLGEVAADGGSFNIADTQFYKNGVSAAYNRGQLEHRPSNVTVTPSINGAHEYLLSVALTNVYGNAVITFNNVAVDAREAYDNGYDDGYAAGYQAAKNAIQVTAGISWSNPSRYYARVNYWGRATINGEQVGYASGVESQNVSGYV